MTHLAQRHQPSRSITSETSLHHAGCHSKCRKQRRAALSLLLASLLASDCAGFSGESRRGATVARLPSFHHASCRQPKSSASCLDCDIRMPSHHHLSHHHHLHNNKLLKKSPFSRTRLTTHLSGDDPNDSKASLLQRVQQSFRNAGTKFRQRPGTYLLIPCVAAAVGWITNWMAVQMIFYPIHFKGIPLYRRPEVPLGLLGWEGIIPCKTKPMTEAMVHMVNTQLLSIKEVFGRLDPRQVARILAPEVPKLTQEIVQEIAPVSWMTGLPGALFNGLDSVSQGILHHFNLQFLTSLTKSLQANIEHVFDLRNCVVDQMMMDRAKLGELFRICGQAELDFLTNSGLWFGFLLGIIQMVVALFFDHPWLLSIGGGIVGFATNWLALKWIFEPVNPTRVGPFVLQGMFLRRQKEVAAEFSSYFARNILTAEKLWNSVLTDPTTQPAFAAIFSSQFQNFVHRITFGFFRGSLEPETMNLLTNKAIEKLPQHVGVTYEYMDKTLGLEKTLRERMEQMTSLQFERVLHPIFEEDEMTLILAGAALGFFAGWIQQGIETGAIQVPNLWKAANDFRKAPRRQTRRWKKRIRVRLMRLRHRLPFGNQIQNVVPNGASKSDVVSSSSGAIDGSDEKRSPEETESPVDEDGGDDTISKSSS